MRRTFLLLVGVVVASLLAGCSLVSDDPDPGPMKPHNAHGYVISMHQGKTFTDGFESLELTGDQPAVILDVEIIGDEGLELAGVELAGPEREL